MPDEEALRRKLECKIEQMKAEHQLAIDEMQAKVDAAESKCAHMHKEIKRYTSDRNEVQIWIWQKTADIQKNEKKMQVMEEQTKAFMDKLETRKTALWKRECALIRRENELYTWQVWAKKNKERYQEGGDFGAEYLPESSDPYDWFSYSLQDLKRLATGSTTTEFIEIGTPRADSEATSSSSLPAAS